MSQATSRSSRHLAGARFRFAETSGILATIVRTAPIIISVAILPLMVSCAGPRTALPSEEVLKNAALTAPGIQSAEFTVNATLHEILPGFAPVTLQTDGILTDGGHQLLFDFDASTTMPGIDESNRLKGSVAVGGEDDVYMRFDLIEGLVLQAIVGPDAASAWVGRWWKLPSQNAETTPAITPDPSVLHMQSQVLRVVQDLGIESFEGADVYHYEVEIDQAKLRAYLQSVLEARGEPVDAVVLDQQAASIAGSGDVWIDADAFYLRRVRWSLRNPTNPHGFRAEIDARLNSFNAAGPIELPVEADPFPINVDQLLQQPTP